MTTIGSTHVQITADTEPLRRGLERAKALLAEFSAPLFGNPILISREYAYELAMMQRAHDDAMNRFFWENVEIAKDE